MKAEAEALLRRVVRAARAEGQHLLAEQLDQVLELEELAPEQVDEATPPLPGVAPGGSQAPAAASSELRVARQPLSNAERCARRRARLRGEQVEHRSRWSSATRDDTRETTRDTSHVVSHVVSRVASRDLDLDPSPSASLGSSQDLEGSLDLETRDDATRDSRHATRDTRHATRESHVANAADDGCMGFAVSAWCEGVRAATGRPMLVQRGALTVALVEALLKYGPEAAEREAWARTKGEAFARAALASGRSLKVLAFCDWLVDGEAFPQRAGVQTPAVGETPAQREARKRGEDARQQKRDDDWARLEREAAPMPPELLAAVGGARPGVRRAR